MAYVQVCCDNCGRPFPKNELREWQQELEIARTSESYGTYADGSTRYQGPKSTFRIERLKLCPACYLSALEAKAEETRRRDLERREAEVASRAARGRGGAGALLGSIGILALLLIGGVAFFRSTQHDTSNLTTGNSEATAGDNQTAAAGTTAQQAPGPSNTIHEATTNTASAFPDQAETPAPQPPPASGEANATANGPPPTPENTPALSKAVADALNTGTPKPWAASGLSGEVTVGDERFYRGRPCRLLIGVEKGPR